MDMLTGIKNFAIVFIIAISMPVIVHTYVTYFYPPLSWGSSFEFDQKIDELTQLHNKLQEVTDYNDKKLDEIRNERNDLTNKKNQMIKIYNDKRANIVFIIVMVIALLFILLSMLVPYHFIKSAFSSGAMLILLYNFAVHWDSMAILVKLISMTVWYVFLILLVVHYYSKEIRNT